MIATRSELEAEVRDCLRRIKDPCSVATGHPLHLDEMGLVKSIDVDQERSRVVVDLRLTSPTCVMVGYFVTEIQQLVRAALPEIEAVEVRFDQGLEWTPSMMSDEVQHQRRRRFAPSG